MAYRYKKFDDIYWFDTYANLIADTTVVKMNGNKAAVSSSPATTYVSDGTHWINTVSGAVAS